jgi:hypothetical protein
MPRPVISVRGDLSTCQFGEALAEPVDVQLVVSKEAPINLAAGEPAELEEPVLEIRFNEATTWRIHLSQDAGAFLAGLLAAESGVTFPRDLDGPARDELVDRICSVCHTDPCRCLASRRTGRQPAGFAGHNNARRRT